MTAFEKGHRYGCTMVHIDRARDIGALMAALRRGIDSNCLVPVSQRQGQTHAIRYVFNSGGSPPQAGKAGYAAVPFSCTIGAGNPITGTGTITVDAMSVSNSGGSVTVSASAYLITTGVWRCVALRRDGSMIRFCVNGIAARSPAYNIVLGAGAASCGIGNRLSDSGRTFNGLIDEVRVPGIVRSADWIWAEDASQRASSAFLTIGADEACSATARGRAIIW